MEIMESGLVMDYGEWESQDRSGQHQYWPRPVSCGATTLKVLRVGALSKYIQSLCNVSGKTRPGTSLHLISADFIMINKRIWTHVHFTQDDVNNAPDDDNEVKDVPGVSKVALHKREIIAATAGLQNKSITICHQRLIFTFALKAISLRIISTVKSTVKIKFTVSESLVTWSDWLQCC